MESGGRWGEAVCDFFACLMQHSKDRALERKSLYYWVCAYANNQWNVSDEIGALDHRDFMLHLSMTCRFSGKSSPKASINLYLENHQAGISARMKTGRKTARS